MTSKAGGKTVNNITIIKRNATPKGTVPCQPVPCMPAGTKMVSAVAQDSPISMNRSSAVHA